MTPDFSDLLLELKKYLFAVDKCIGPELRKNIQRRTVTEKILNRSLLNKIERLMAELRTQKMPNFLDLRLL